MRAPPLVLGLTVILSSLPVVESTTTTTQDFGAMYSWSDGHAIAHSDPHGVHVAFVNASRSIVFQRLPNGPIEPIAQLGEGFRNYSRFLTILPGEFPRVVWAQEFDFRYMVYEAARDSNSWTVSQVLELNPNFDTFGSNQPFDRRSISSATRSPSGAPAFAYVDHLTGRAELPLRIGLATKGSGWSTEIVATSPDPSVGVQLIFDAAGSPHILGSFRNASIYKTVHYWKTGSSWQSEIVPSYAAGFVAKTVLNPEFVTTATATSAGIQIARRQQTGWENISIVPSSVTGANAFASGISINETGGVAVVWGHYDQATVKTTYGLVAGKDDNWSPEVDLGEIGSPLLVWDATQGLHVFGAKSQSGVVTAQRIRVHLADGPMANFSFPAAATTRTEAVFEDFSGAAAGRSLATREWNFGDGTSSSENRPTKRFVSPGRFWVQLTITDSAGAMDRASAPIEVARMLPAACFYPSTANARVSENVTFANCSSHPETSRGATMTYSWDFADGASSAQESPSRPYSTAGTYSIRLTVTDEQGASASTSRTVTVTAPPPNQPPTASFASAPISPRVRQTVTFTSSAADPDGSITSHEWRINGTVANTTSSFSTSFQSPGNRVIRLTVSDDGGASRFTEQTVTVLPLQPMTLVGIDASMEKTAGTEFTLPLTVRNLNPVDVAAHLRAEVSSTDAWGLGFEGENLTVPANGESTVSLNVAIPGSGTRGIYTLTIRAESDGLEPASASIRVTVHERPRDSSTPTQESDSGSKLGSPPAKGGGRAPGFETTGLLVVLVLAIAVLRTRKPGTGRPS